MKSNEENNKASPLNQSRINRNKTLSFSNLTPQSNHEKCGFTNIFDAITSSLEDNNKSKKELLKNENDFNRILLDNFQKKSEYYKSLDEDIFKRSNSFDNFLSKNIKFVFNISYNNNCIYSNKIATKNYSNDNNNSIEKINRNIHPLNKKSIPNSNFSVVNNFSLTLLSSINSKKEIQNEYPKKFLTKNLKIDYNKKITLKCNRINKWMNLTKISKNNKLNFCYKSIYEKNKWNEVNCKQNNDSFQLVSHINNIFYSINSTDNIDYQLEIGKNNKEILYHLSKRDIMYLWNKLNKIDYLDISKLNNDYNTSNMNLKNFNKEFTFRGRDNIIDEYKQQINLKEEQDKKYSSQSNFYKSSNKKVGNDNDVSPTKFNRNDNDKNNNSNNEKNIINNNNNLNNQNVKSISYKKIRKLVKNQWNKCNLCFMGAKSFSIISNNICYTKASSSLKQLITSEMYSNLNSNNTVNTRQSHILNIISQNQSFSLIKNNNINNKDSLNSLFPNDFLNMNLQNKIDKETQTESKDFKNELNISKTSDTIENINENLIKDFNINEKYKNLIDIYDSTDENMRNNSSDAEKYGKEVFFNENDGNGSNDDTNIEYHIKFNKNMKNNIQCSKNNLIPNNSSNIYKKQCIHKNFIKINLNSNQNKNNIYNNNKFDKNYNLTFNNINRNNNFYKSNNLDNFANDPFSLNYDKNRIFIGGNKIYKK